MKLETCVKFADNWSTKCSASDKWASARISGKKKPIRITLWCHGSLQMLAHQKLRGLSSSINSFLPCSAKLSHLPLWFCTLNINTRVSREVICSVNWWQLRLNKKKAFRTPTKSTKLKTASNQNTKWLKIGWNAFLRGNPSYSYLTAKLKHHFNWLWFALTGGN